LPKCHWPTYPCTGNAEFDGAAFNGAFLHPNCHSLYVSLFVLFLASLYLLAPYRHRRIVLPMILLWVVFMVMSKSRTSVIAAIAPLPFLILYAKPKIASFGRRLQPNVRRTTLLGVLVLFGVAVLFADAATDRNITKAIVAFMNKSSYADDTAIDTEVMLSSRRGLIEYSWKNFLDNPMHGIGFQVSKTDAFVRGATLFTAPSEKGFLPTAVLEEGGIFGTAMFVIFIGTLMGSWIRERNVPALIVFLGFLASNFGEVSIFAPGGSGAFGWIMVGAASILGDHCWRRPLGASQRPPEGLTTRQINPLAA